jgi:hypothetical protein
LAFDADGTKVALIGWEAASRLDYTAPPTSLNTKHVDLSVTAYVLVGVAVACTGGRALIREGRDGMRPSSRRNYPAWKVAAIKALVFVLLTGAVILLWPLLIKEIAKRVRESRPENIREFWRQSRAADVAMEWLKNRITVAEAEAKHMVRTSAGAVAFGLQNGQWRELRGLMRDGDEMWEYCSSADSWKHLAGRAGIALVRKGQIVDAITTAMN